MEIPVAEYFHEGRTDGFVYIYIFYMRDSSIRLIADVAIPVLCDRRVPLCCVESSWMPKEFWAVSWLLVGLWA